MPLKIDHPRPKSQRVLFVDDQQEVLDGIRRLLRAKKLGLDMEFATSVDQALMLLADKDFDAVISDMKMPKRDGFDLLRAMGDSASLKDIPVVILTGLQESGLKGKALEYGATDLLQKPVDPDELMARLKSVLRLKAYQDAIKEQNAILDRKVRERTQDLEFARIDLIWRLGKAGEYRDEETGNHVIRVGHYCRVLAEALGQPEEFVKRIFLTSPLHDVGKIGIPDYILLKAGRLNDQEWQIMKSHPLIGHDLLSPGGSFQKYAPMSDDATRSSLMVVANNPVLNMAASIALGHHEWWNGAGYPHGLKGEDIPLQCRIAAIADVYDALLSERPYKKACSEPETLRIMGKNIGTQFDPRIFDSFETSLPAFRDIRQRFRDD